MFKFEKNLPDYYLNNSRDFQLLARLMEVPYNSSQLYANNISKNANSIDKSVDGILPLLAIKLGLFSYNRYPNNILRVILQNFIQIIKNKGTKKAIELVITSYYIANKLTGDVLVASGRDLSVIEDSDYSMIILLTDEFTDLTLLNDLLSYVIPAGINYYMAKASSQDLTTMLSEIDNDAIIVRIKSGDFHNIRSARDEYTLAISNEYMNTVAFTELKEKN